MSFIIVIRVMLHITLCYCFSKSEIHDSVKRHLLLVFLKNDIFHNIYLLQVSCQNDYIHLSGDNWMCDRNGLSRRRNRSEGNKNR